MKKKFWKFGRLFLVEGIWNSKRGGLLQRYMITNCHRKWGLVVLESGGIYFKRDFQHAQKERGKQMGEKTQLGRRTYLRMEKTQPALGTLHY